MSRAESPGPAGYRSTTRATVPPETPDGGRPRTFERPMHLALAVVTVVLIAATMSTGVWVTMHWGTGSAEFDFSVEADTGLKISERRLINAT